jgi:hypothetical protein
VIRRVVLPVLGQRWCVRGAGANGEGVAWGEIGLGGEVPVIVPAEGGSSISRHCE